MNSRRVTAVVACALLFAACGSSATPTPAGNPAPAASPAAPAASQAAAPSAAAPSAPASVAPAASVADVGGAATALSNLTSYEVTVTATGGSDGGTADIIVVRTPTPAQSFTADFGGQKLRIISIGTDVWVDSGTGTFVKNAIPQAAAQAMTAGFDPGTYLSLINKNGFLHALQTVGQETKNGVPTLHLHGDHSTPVAAGQPTIPPGAVIDVWVSADGGYLVALEGTGITDSSGPSSVKLEVTHINDSSLKVSPPA
jgi:hypothetical protein